MTLAARSLDSIEKMMRDVAAGRRDDVSFADLADMVGSVRTGLAGTRTQDGGVR